MKISCSILDLGRMEYDTALSLQRHLIQEKRNGREEDILLFVEHPPVITMGRGGNGKNILVDSRTLSDRGVSFYEIERGGDVTYHGPGQIVGYPIFDLNRHGKDLHRFLRNLEEVLILTLETFGLKGRREKGMTGVWVNGEKVAAIGVAVKHWITFHGFALNVNTDLSYFDLICPCGIAERGITSLEKLLGRQVKLGEVK